VRANSVGFLMKKTLYVHVPAAVTSLLASFFLSHAKGQVMEVNPIVVSASRMEQPLADVLSSVSVFTREDIEKAQAQSLADLLQGEAGFEFARNGGRGATTSFFLRGLDSVNLVILVDGVRVQTDAIGSTTSNDFPLFQIERIEILRGNATSLYGEAAVGGVINIQTRRGQGEPAGYGEISLGTRNTENISAGYGGQNEDIKFNMNLSQSGSSGFSAINAKTNTGTNPDNDGYKVAYFGGNLEKKIETNSSLGLRFNTKNTNTNYDTATSGSAINNFKTSNNSFGVFGRKLINDYWTSTLDISTSQFVYKDYKNGALNSDYYGGAGYYAGVSNVIKWTNNYVIDKNILANFGVDKNLDSYRQTSGYESTRNRFGLFSGVNYTIQDWSFQGNLRVDKFKTNTSDFTTGSYTLKDAITAGTGTYSAVNSNKNQYNSWLLGGGYKLFDHLKINGTLSTGFRAPTPFDVLRSPSTVSETSRSQEVGLTYSDSKNLAKLAYFNTTINNAIVYDDTNDTSSNVGKARNKGIEANLRTNFAGNSLKMAFVQQDPWNVTDGIALKRRAKQYGSFDISRSLKSVNVGAKFYASSRREDYDLSYKTVVTSGYSTWSLYAFSKLDSELTARIKLENAFNRNYELASGYNTPGRGIYATLQYQPK
jgi:vitamin B12 transporter